LAASGNSVQQLTTYAYAVAQTPTVSCLVHYPKTNP
jgi:hypothetical protein